MPVDRSRNATKATVGITLAAIFTIAAVVIAAQGVLASIKSSDRASAHAPLTTRVTDEHVVVTVEGVVELSPAFVRVVSAPNPSGDTPIFTRNGAAPHEAISRAGVIATVDERPVVAMLGAVPSYRNLGPGISGNDVKQLQENLERSGFDVWDERGTFGASTSAAVRALYARLGFGPVDADGHAVPDAARDAGIPSGEVVFLPSFPASADGACGVVGTVVEASICTLTGPPTAVRLTVPTADATAVTAGLTVRLTGASGNSIEAVVAEQLSSASLQANSSADVPSSRPAADTVQFGLTVPRRTKLDSLAGARAVVLVDESSARQRSVESVAIRSDDAGRSWLVSRAGKTLPVTVGLCGGGRCAISGAGIVRNTVVLMPDPSAVGR